MPYVLEEAPKLKNPYRSTDFFVIYNVANAPSKVGARTFAAFSYLLPVADMLPGSKNNVERGDGVLSAQGGAWGGAVPAAK